MSVATPAKAATEAAGEPIGRRRGDHLVSFERNTVTRRWRALCSCGWLGFGSEDEVKTAAAGHDIEWTPMGQFEAAAIRRDNRP